MTVAGMTKAEREDLQRLIRQREKVQKSAALLRSKELLADFENQLAAEYSFDDDRIWAEAARTAQSEVAKVNEHVAARCAELGIPKRFAPSLSLDWHHRGYDNSLDRRKKELRRVAQSRVEALEQQAIVDIEQASVDALTKVALAGLASQAALEFVNRLPTIESLMPALSYREIAGETDPPIVEQLLTPNALRQRRYRDRQRALRDANVMAIEGSRNAGADDGGEA